MFHYILFPNNTMIHLDLNWLEGTKQNRPQAKPPDDNAPRKYRSKTYIFYLK